MKLKPPEQDWCYQRTTAFSDDVDFNDGENDEKEDGVPCEKERRSKLYIIYKLVMMFDYNVEQT